SNRRPDGAQPCKQHSDWALSLMLLGDFETGFWARSAVTAFQPRLAGDCEVWHGMRLFGLDLTPPDYSESNKSQTQYDNYAPLFYAKML
ncbi:MAG: hypothetical protein L0G47_07650, partial [Lacticaseibacillus paracasei]|nr:hypothetical protein [Lacticaseibacillus paracasei]